jgi:hypothetical protein
LKPIPFWKSVPDSIIAIYHFFNVPITAGRYDKHSPIRLIKKIAKEYDFVSFKLDIDTPAVEIPIALELIKDNELIQLVDEFFFELHFHCEFMEHCGWGAFEMPSIFPPDKKLDRQYTLKLFHTMRQNGIRAHIWP